MYRGYISLFKFIILGFSFTVVSCKKNIPENRLSLGDNTDFTIKTYQPVLGRNTLFSDNFSVGTSSLPLDFKIVNMRRFNGESAQELLDFFPVKIWKEPYTGTEKSLAEIEAKRTIESHQLFEIRKHAGQFLMWAWPNKSNAVQTQPDSGYVFDVEMSNSGGRKYFRDLKLRPLKERPYEPSNLDPITGQATNGEVNVSLISNIRGEKTNRLLDGSDIKILFNQINTTGNSLSFRFVDTLFNPIDPNKFATTKWGELIHGFDPVITTEKASYKVAYPIPLIAYPTKYTNGDGGRSRAIFRYERQGFGNVLERAQLGLDFAIFEPGDWEIIFWFKTEKPKFIND